MRQVGNVEIPQGAFIAALKMGDELTSRIFFGPLYFAEARLCNARQLEQENRP